MRTRNNTDDNKLVIFSSIASYYGDNYTVYYVHVHVIYYPWWLLRMQLLANHSSSRACEREPRNAVGTYLGSKDQIFVGPWLTGLSRVCRESPAGIAEAVSRETTSKLRCETVCTNVLTTMIEYRSLNSYCFVVGN